MHITDFECKYCGARIGEICRSRRTGKQVSFHFARDLALIEAAHGPEALKELASLDDL